MAIPTQFSVTSTRTSPIANPLLLQDAPQLLDAENVSIVDGASVLASLSGGLISAPSEATAQPATTVDTAVTIPAEAQASIDTPVEANSRPIAVIDTPIEATALNAAVIDNANTLPAETSAAIATPTAASVLPSANISTPTAASVLPSANISTPTAATAESIPTADTPSVLTARPGTLTTPPFPLNHARILYDNVLQDFLSVSATNEEASSPAINALKPNTFEKWRFATSASTFQVDYGGSTRSFDMLCIGSHNLGRAGATVEVWYEPEPGGTFFKFDVTKNPAAGDQQFPITFYRQSPVNALSIEVRITSAASNVNIGYISAGIALQMQRPFFNGHTPITDGDVTDYYSNRTESGEIIGQQIRRKGFETSADWQNIDDTWYREYFAPFKQSAKTRPFFFAWNLLEYPDDVGFCRIAQDISAPMQNGTRTKRSISMNLLGAG